MADKEEVEPADESSRLSRRRWATTPPTSPSEPTASGLTGCDRRLRPSDPVDPAWSSAAEEPSDDEFDEIVRRSGMASGDNDERTTRLGSTRTTTDSTTSGDAEPNKVLEPAGVEAGSRVAGAAKRRPPECQGRRDRRRDQPEKPERTGPVKFVRESVGELRKVVYPTGQQLINYFVVVLVFVLFIIAYVSLLDLGLGAAIFKIFS